MQDLQETNQWSPEKITLLDSLKEKHGKVLAMRFKDLEVEDSWVYAFLKPMDFMTKIKLWEAITAGRGQTTASGAMKVLLLPESDTTKIDANDAYQFGIIEAMMNEVQIAIPDVKKK